MVGTGQGFKKPPHIKVGVRSITISQGQPEHCTPVPLALQLNSAVPSKCKRIPLSSHFEAEDKF